MGAGSCRYQAPWAPRSSNPHIRDRTESGAGEARSHLNRSSKNETFVRGRCSGWVACGAVKRAFKNPDGNERRDESSGDALR
jgi:hypothetical protein